MKSLKNITLKQLAGYISEQLRNDEIESILVGGACVTIYSNNRYQSYDLDFVTYSNLSNVKKSLHKIGFQEFSGYFRHKDCPWIIEFVSPPVAVGAEIIDRFANIQTTSGTIKMLTPVDSIKDRLASFFHWDDLQGLEQAINICLEVKEIDFEELKQWSQNEKCEEKFDVFLHKLQKSKT